MKVNRDPFSNGEDYRWWTARNCDRCVKSMRLKDGCEEWTKCRCAIFRDIDLRMVSNRPIAQRTIDVCSKNDCPYRQEKWKNHPHKV